MRIALIGDTGFVGSHIKKEFKNISSYNSRNIDTIKNSEWDVLIISAPSSNKLLANRNSDLDLESINNLLENLKHVQADRVFIVSSISCINHEIDMPYGRNRVYFNKKIEEKFENVTIQYYPLIKGEGVRKGYFRDINSEYPLYLLQLLDPELSKWYQYSDDYDLWIWNKDESEDLLRILKSLDISPKNFYNEIPESIDVKEIVEELKKYVYENK